MSKNIYVGNLPYETTGDDLVQLFETYGSVTGGQVIMDRFSGRSRGFGFVVMDDDQEADAAIGALDGQPYGGRPLTVNEARPREEQPNRGYGGGGYGGGGHGGAQEGRGQRGGGYGERGYGGSVDY
jgi:cold-inducible RNA-binding protein